MNITKSVGIVTGAIPIVGILIGGITFGINFNHNPLQTIQKRRKALETQDVLVILGSHYFGPHINKIYKNCFDIQSK